MYQKLAPIVPLGLLTAPSIAAAQGLQEFMVNLATVLNDVVIPFLIGIAFLIFAYNAIRYFVLGGSREDGRENAKALALYGILAFVLIITFWGIINLIASSIGLDGDSQPMNDYVEHGTPGAPPYCPPGVPGPC